MSDPTQEATERFLKTHMLHVEKMACAWYELTGIPPNEAQIVERREGFTMTITIERKTARLCDHPCEKCARPERV